MYYIDENGNKIPYSSLLDEMYYNAQNKNPDFQTKENEDRNAGYMRFLSWLNDLVEDSKNKR